MQMLFSSLYVSFIFIKKNCNFLIKGRIIYQSDSIYYHITGENFNFYVYIFFELIDTFFLNLLLMIISINWFIFMIIFLKVSLQIKKRLKIFRVISYEESQKRKLNLAIVVCRFVVFLVIASLIPIIVLCSELEKKEDYNEGIFIV